MQEVDLRAEHANLAPEVVCRTCIFKTNRTGWMDPKTRAATPPAKLVRCQPDLHLVNKLVVEDRRHQVIRLENHKDAPVVGFVSSCGQGIRKVCLACERFRPVTVDVPTQSWPGGPTWQRQVVVGGHCGIPAEGIIVAGQVKFCDPKIRRSAIVPSCSNCMFRWNTSAITDNHDLALSVGEIDLDPYERHMIRLSVLERNWDHLEKAFSGADAAAIAGQISRVQSLQMNFGSWNVDNQIRSGFNEATRRKAMVPIGAYKFFPATITKTYTHPTRTKLASGRVVVRNRTVATDVVFAGSGVKATIFEDDDNLEVIPHRDGVHATVRILLPHHRQFRLTPAMSIATKRLGGIPLAPGQRELNLDEAPVSKLTNKPIAIRPTASDRVIRFFSRIDNSAYRDPNCPRCSPHNACWFHTQGPVADHEGEVTFSHPRMILPLPYRPWRHEVINGRIRITDSDGNELRPAFIRIHLANIAKVLLTAQDPNASPVSKEIRFTFGERDMFSRAGRPKYSMVQIRVALRSLIQIMAAAPNGKARQSQFNFGRPAHRLEPFKTYCALNLHHPDEGIDFRTAWNDRFGTSRSEMSTSVVSEASGPVIRGLGNRVIGMGVATGSDHAGECILPQVTRDQYFSWTKAQDLEEYLRTTSAPDRPMYGHPGIGEAIWVTEQILRAKREEYKYSPTEMPESIKIITLPVAGPEDMAATELVKGTWQCLVDRGHRFTGAELALSTMELSRAPHGVPVRRFQIGATGFVDVTCPTCSGDMVLVETDEPEHVAYDVIDRFVGASGSRRRMRDDTKPRRSIEGAVLPDGVYWQESRRLSEMVCSSWTQRSFSNRRKPLTWNDVE